MVYTATLDSNEGAWIYLLTIIPPLSDRPADVRYYTIQQPILTWIAMLVDSINGPSGSLMLDEYDRWLTFIKSGASGLPKPVSLTRRCGSTIAESRATVTEKTAIQGEQNERPLLMTISATTRPQLSESTLRRPPLVESVTRRPILTNSATRRSLLREKATRRPLYSWRRHEKAATRDERHQKAATHEERHEKSPKTRPLLSESAASNSFVAPSLSGGILVSLVSSGLHLALSVSHGPYHASFTSSGLLWRS